VTGVVADPPSNNTIEFDVLLSMKGFPVDKLHWSWVWTQLETFVLLRESADITTVREKLKPIPRKRADETIRAVMDMTFDEYIKSGKEWDLYLQPITSLHLPDAPIVGSFPDTGNIRMIYSFIGAAIFIVLLSCINFMNLSMAQFTRRIKEASIRKILGMDKRQLRMNYFIEALVFCMLGLVVGVALTEIFLPGFNFLVGKQLSIDFFRDPILTIGLLALVFIMSVTSAGYPAIFLSTFNPVNSLKGRSRLGQEGKGFRNGLVVFQFCASITLVICTAVIFQQLNFASQKDLGFNRENLLVLHHAELATNGSSLADEALQIHGSVNASYCNSVPPTVFGGDTFAAEGVGDHQFALNYTSADDKFIPTLGITLKYGQNFREDSPSDSMQVILNESAIAKIGWPLDESVIGRRLRYPNSGDPSLTFEVIGVVEDFNYWSIATPIEPMAIFHNSNRYVGDSGKNFVVIRIEPQNPEAWESTFADLRALWKRHADTLPLEYSFIDANFARTFATHQQFGNVLSVLAALAIIIASLGLLGMIVYSLEQRTKEIGIRKVAGASVYNILVLISKGYARLILIAFLIAAPLSWYMMKLWLRDFAYSITPSVWIFLACGFGMLVLSFVITSYHSIKAATTNPVDVLKDE
jgi:putative ABC transport system permease protein